MFANFIGCLHKVLSIYIFMSTVYVFKLIRVEHGKLLKQ